jgi:hypothetical protein
MTEARTMKIFRAADAPLRSETEQLPHTPLTPEEAPGFARMRDAGYGDAAVLKLLFEGPGFSLVYVWFKPHFPLVRHSHSTDCLYYIVAGDVRLGDQTLGPGDGFFVPKEAPYTYRMGDAGAEILEFRHSPLFTTKYVGATPAFFESAIKTLTENRAAWQAMVPPRPAERSPEATAAAQDRKKRGYLF